MYQLLKAFPSPDFDPPLDSLMKDGFGGQYCAQHLGLWQHPFGSARIGPVLDHQLRVRGVEDLYVADASALPDWALAGHPDAGIRAVGSLVAQFAAADVERKKRSFDKFAQDKFLIFCWMCMAECLLHGCAVSDFALELSTNSM